MYKALSLKLEPKIFSDTEKLIKKMKVPRNAYLNQAIEFYNQWQSKRLLSKQFKKEVSLLKKQTQEFIESYELLDDLPNED